MQSYEGTVLFVDMLGFSALTRGMLTLGPEQYEHWGVDAGGASPHQLLAAKILLAFRKTLLTTKKSHKDVKIAQLSDCAFLWSKDTRAVIDAGRRLMHEAISNGLLCRGGLASGSIHEPNEVNRSLGAFIVGDAVTRAATFESMGKGTRVFTDAATASEVMEVRGDECFQPLVDPMTGVVVDEWQWYAQPPLRIERGIKQINEAVERLVSYHTILRYSPKLAWSATSLEGRRQIACSIAAVSDVMEKLSGKTGNFEFSVEQLLVALDKRSDNVCQRIKETFRAGLAEAIKREQKKRHRL